MMEIINKGADVNAKDLGERTPIFYALRYLDTVDYLLSRGASLNDLDNSNNSLLHTAASESAVDFIEKYHSQFDMNAKNSKGETPLHNLADSAYNTKDSQDKKSETALLLLKYGANIEERNEDNQTALEIIAKKEYKNGCDIQLMTTLLIEGAKPYFPISSSYNDTDAETNFTLPILVAFGAEYKRHNDEIVEKSHNIEPILKELNFTNAQIIKAKIVMGRSRTVDNTAFR